MPRTYHPPLVKLSDIAGQQRAVALLQAALTHDRVHHALLFAGPSGVGKETTARALAASLLCESAGGRPVADACGVCDGCRRVQRGVHPDLLWIMPDAEAVARKLVAREDLDRVPSRDLRIEQVRKLDAALSLAPHGPRRVVILAQADAMNASAQNALLKTLEEPPPGNHLVLLADAPDKLLPTIRSRCQRIAFVPLPEAWVAEQVVREKGLPQATARVAAALAGGSVGAALALDPEVLADRARLIGEVEALTADDARSLLRLAENVAGEGRDGVEQRLDELALFYRDVAAAGEGSSANVSEDLSPLIEKAARRGVQDALRRSTLLAEAREALRFNGAARLAVERMLLGFVFGELP